MEANPIDQRKYFNEMNKFNTDNLFNPSLTGSNDMFKNRSMPKGFLSEYQHSFFNNPNEHKQKNILGKPRDSLSFGNKSFLQESFVLENIKNNDKNEFPMRSKTLNRLNKMIPDESSSWYKSDYNYYGNDDQNLSNSIEIQKEPIRNPANSLNNPLKNDYLKKFDEMNKGLVDSYSLSKGGTLLQIKNDSLSSRENLVFNQINQNKNNNSIRNHDLRSVWIPKKFEGRNMFASHIDSMIFPDKTDKEFDTQYNQNFDSSVDAKKVFDKPSYDKIEKSVKYVMDHESKYVPSVRWYPKEDTQFYHTHEEQIQEPSKSIYQADFEAPLVEQSNKYLVLTGPVDNKQTRQALDQLYKKRFEIDQALAKS